MMGSSFGLAVRLSLLETNNSIHDDDDDDDDNDLAP